MKLPEFKTEAQERKFWEKHSIADYWKDLRDSDDRFKRPKLTPVTIKSEASEGLQSPSRGFFFWEVIPEHARIQTQVDRRQVPLLALKKR